MAVKKTSSSKKKTSTARPVSTDEHYNAHAITAFVMGILGIMFGWMIIGIPCIILAIVFGLRSLREIKKTKEQGRGLALSGLIMGYVGVGLLVLTILLFVVMMLFASMSMMMLSNIADMDMTVDGDDVSMEIDFVDPQAEDIVVRDGIVTVIQPTVGG